MSLLLTARTAADLAAMFSQAAVPMKIIWLILFATVLETSVNAFQPSTLPSTPRRVPSNVRVRRQSVSLHGKLWKRLQIDEDDPSDGTRWYLINCVAGVELDLLNQCRIVCDDFPKHLVEKFVVPTQRHLRSHGEKKKVVDVKVRYPGYVFCKICLVEDVYEKLQNLELARSWMGTVNRKGHKKLPPSPLPLNDEEVKKFKGLEEEQELFEDMFAGDYTGRNDTGADLLAQYQGYDVGQMVKILRGNFKDEDGTVRRLKDGQLMVRMFTYGQTYDEWFDPDAIRPLTDLEVLRGMSGPTVPVNQDQFDVSIGKKDPSILEGTARDSSMQSESSLRSGLMQSAGVAPGRNRREDRVARGETGQRDMFGRSSADIKKEEENWLAYREERRAGARGEASAPAPIETPKKKAEGPKKGQDTWGIVERSSWTGGEYGFEADSEQEENQRIARTSQVYQDREPRGRRGRIDTAERRPRDFDNGRERRDRRSERPSSLSSESDDDSGSESDFFDNLIGELNDDLGSKDSPDRRRDGPGTTRPKTSSKDEDFFESLMSELGESLDESPGRRTTQRHDNQDRTKTGGGKENGEEDDFFNNLMVELSDSLDDASSEGEGGSDMNDDFFANLESELGETFGSGSTKETLPSDDDDDFFASLQTEMEKALEDTSESADTKEGIDDDFFDDFFAGFTTDDLVDDLAKELDAAPAAPTFQSVDTKVLETGNEKRDDLASLTVPELKDLLRGKGLKLGGKKAELIDRLLSS